MLSIKEFDLVRYSEQEVVFKNRRDLVSALQELSTEKDILVTYREGDKLRSIILMANTFIKFRNGEVGLFAEEEVTEAS